jgi:hypothetical protein
MKKIYKIYKKNNSSKNIFQQKPFLKALIIACGQSKVSILVVERLSYPSGKLQLKKTNPNAT